MRLAAVLTFLLCFSGAAFAAERYQILEDRAAGPGEPLLLVLRDNAAGVEAAIAPAKGGELSSFRIRHKGQWVETLYRARDYTEITGWSGKAPLLWPATGRSRPPGETDAYADPEGAYVRGGRRYPMPLHGFVRDMEWKVESRQAGASAAKAVLWTGDTPETRRGYPFGFRLTVEYCLSEGRLAIAYTVASSPRNSRQMPFSIGNHITFRAPLLEGTDPEEMLFQTPSTIEYLKVPPGLPTGETRPRSFATPVRLGEIPRLEAVSLGGYEDDPYMVLTDPQGLAIRMSHSASSLPPPPVILFNVWGDPEDGYFSPEPWVGLQNSLNLQQGLVRLRPGTLWNWTIEIHSE